MQRAEPTPHDRGGAQRILRTGLMAEFFRRSGHDVTWFTSTFDHYNRCQRFAASRVVEVALGYRIHYLHAKSYRRNVSLARLMHERKLAREFTRAVRDVAPPDLIICSLPSVHMAAATAKYARDRAIALVCDVRDLWPDVFLDLLPASLRSAGAVAIAPMRRKLATVISQSDAVTGLTDEYIDWAFGYAKRIRGPQDVPLAMAYMPTQEFALAPADEARMAAKFDCRNGELEVLFIGTLGPMMRIEPIIEAAKALELSNVPVRIRVCGAGSDFDRLRALASGLGNISFPGWIEAAEIGFLLKRSHIGLLPYADLDTFRWSIPNKLGEYLAGSLMLLHNLADSAMKRMIVSEGAGEIYYDDPRQLVAVLTKLAHDPPALKTYRTAAATLYRERFHGPEVYAGFVKRMENLVASRHA